MLVLDGISILACVGGSNLSYACWHYKVLAAAVLAWATWYTYFGSDDP